MRNIFIFGVSLLVVFILVLIISKNPFLDSASKLIIGPTPSPKILTKLKVIHVARNASKPVVAVAMKNKIFEKYGLEVEVNEVTSGNASVQGLIGGQANITLSSQVSYLKAAAAGAKIKSVGIVNNNTAWVFVSRKDPKDIKSYCTVGLTTEDYLRGVLVLKNLGIDINSLNLTNLASADLCAKTLASGNVDSMVFQEINWELFKNKNKEASKYKVIIKAVGEKYLNKPLTIIVMENTLNTKKDAIENFSKAIIEANYWLKNHSESEIEEAINGVNKITKEEAIIYAKLMKEYLVGVKFSQEISNVEEIRKENEGVSPKLKEYDVKNFLSTLISDSLNKQGFLQKYGF
jgi:NitT/TauT family transport system substrate-binding protein